MPENNIHEQLRKNFRQANKELWRQAASKEIEGKDPFEILSWQNSDNLKFSPYYDSADVEALTYLDNFHNIVGENASSECNHWLNVPRVFVSDEKEANKISLDHLQNGADGVLYIVSPQTQLNKLLEHIEWEHCSLLFKSPDKKFYCNILPEFIREKQLNKNRIAGALFWETVPKKDEVKFYFENTPNLKSLGITLSSQPPVNAIADVLAKTVNLIEELRDDNNIETIISSIAFSVPADAKFLDSIAKLKALRLLWYQVAQAYGVNQYHPSHLHLHAFSEVWIDKKYEPHGNMIKATTAAMASILGGCNSLTVHEQDAGQNMMGRVARNVSSILKEEAHLDKVVNPVAGTYAINTMVNEVARLAWQQFQSNLK